MQDIVIFKDCPCCHKRQKVVLPAEYGDAYNEWMNGTLIQHTRLIELDVATRETLISGVCPECWNSLFGGEMDEAS